ncbi:MAG: hypothetical protein KDD47_24220 [Acidobacteria bacterium]|nr:hypothetical protein [Acidobacteriota bacterium]
MNDGKARLWVLTSLILGMVPVASAQDMGLSNAKGKIAREKGISHYHLLRDGNVVRATVFGPGESNLAECQIEFFERKAVADCTLTEGGKYRWAVDKAAETLFFEDLDTGESATARFNVTKPLPDGWIVVPPGEEPPHEETEIVVTGSKSSKEEFDRDWGEAASLMGLIVGEVMWTLEVNLSALGTTPGAELPPQGVDELCDPATSRWVCQTMFGVPGRGRLESEDRCCAIASINANFTCSIVTDRSCCANSFCSLTCLGSICNCDLTGYPWECVLCD